MGGTGIEYTTSFNLAAAAGQLITTYDKLNPPRGQPKASNPNGRVFRGVVSPRRKLSAVNVAFSGSASQTMTVSIRDRDSVARVISTQALSSLVAGSYVPDHDIWIGPKEHFQVDVTNTATPAITGSITIFTEEN